MRRTEHGQAEIQKNEDPNSGGVSEGQGNFFGQSPSGKLLLKLALPTVAAQLINMLYNIVDRIYTGISRISAQRR